MMTDLEYDQRATEVFQRIETALDANGVDIEYETHGGILELEFADESKIVINRQAPLQEIWVAGRAGGFHYRWDGASWRDTRSGDELFDVLSSLVRQQAGVNIEF